MTAEFRCSACQRRIARRGRHFVTPGAALILCTGCVSSPDVHRKLFPGCHVDHDCSLEHTHPTATAAGVAWLQNHP